MKWTYLETKSTKIKKRGAEIKNINRYITITKEIELVIKKAVYRFSTVHIKIPNRRTHSKIHMESQNIPNSQIILKKENW